MLIGTPRNLGSKVRLLLTLTDSETAAVIWRGHLFSPFDELVHGFDDLASKIAQSDKTEGNSAKINRLISGAAGGEQRERIDEARESARHLHNLNIKRMLSRGEKNSDTRVR